MSTIATPITGAVLDPWPVPHLQPGAELPVSGAAIAPHLTFWQEPWVQNLLPHITSITVHLVIIIIAILLIPPLQKLTQMVKQEQVIVPDASFTEGPVGGIPNPGLGGDPNRAAAQDQF